MVLSVSSIQLARAHFHLGEFEEAREIAELVLRSMPQWSTALTILLASLWKLDRTDEAAAIAAAVQGKHPEFSVDRWAGGFPYRNAEDLAALMDPLIAAGLAE